MKRPVLYGIFILKFFFGLGLIIWTVMMTISSDVGQDDDNAFLSSYHDVDDNFNNMIISNIKFKNKYNLEFNINDTVVKGLMIDDIYLSQRVIKKRDIRKNLLKVGKNTFSYKITTKDNKIIKDVKVNILVTMTTNHTFDKKLNFKDKEIEIFTIDKQGYWNITGTIEIGKFKGYYFIKTNSK
jgi:hypothetical protein